MTIKKQNNNEQQWKLLVLLIKEAAIDKYGKGWTKELAKKTSFFENNVSRMLGLKYSPSVKNLMILADALEIDISIAYNLENKTIIKQLKDFDLVFDENKQKLKIKTNNNGN